MGNGKDLAVIAAAGAIAYIAFKALGNGGGDGDGDGDGTALPAPDMTFASPANFSAVAVSPILFSWGSVAGAARYHIQIANSPTFAPVNGVGSVVRGSSALAGLTFSASFSSLSFGDYYWRVRAYDAAGLPGAWSPVFTLRWGSVVVLLPPDAPNMEGASPPDRALLNVSSITFTWGAAARAETYHIQIAITPDFFLPEGGGVVRGNAALTGTTFTANFANLPDGPYWWRVRARNIVGASPWGTAFVFTKVTP